MSVPESSIEASAARLRAATPRAPEIGFVLGSGWDAIAGRVQDAVDIPYAELPAFPRPGVAGHAGSLRLGTIAGRGIALLRGRRHAYEDGDAGAMTGAIRTLAALGCRVLVLTNAAGSLNLNMPAGSLMLIADHLNIAQRSPLVGESGDARFVDMVDAYDPTLRALTRAAAQANAITLHEGTYAWVLGPQFETPAEIRMLRTLGADAVGMSTVPETIAARHAGMAVLGLSLITNLAAGLTAERLSHAGTLAAAEAGAQAAATLLEATLAQLQPESP